MYSVDERLSDVYLAGHKYYVCAHLAVTFIHLPLPSIVTDFPLLVVWPHFHHVTNMIAKDTRLCASWSSLIRVATLCWCSSSVHSQRWQWLCVFLMFLVCVHFDWCLCLRGASRVATLGQCRADRWGHASYEKICGRLHPPPIHSLSQPRTYCGWKVLSLFIFKFKACHAPFGCHEPYNAVAHLLE